MSGGRASFEIQVLRSERWVTEQVRDTESAARAIAKTIFAKPQCAGVRILKNWTRADGTVTENTIHTETRQVAEPKVTITAVEEAPYCRKTAEYYQLDSRMTINRLFRKYIEKVYLTPTELIHNYKALKKVQDEDSLFPSAVDRVATIQAQTTGEDVKIRKDEIYRVVAKMTQRARKVEEAPNLPKLKGNDFGKVIARIEAMAPPDEVDFYSLVVLSQELSEHRSWLGKLDRLVSLTGPDQQSEVLALLDGVIADLFGVPTALQDVLGYQRNLAQALCAIADLCDGRFNSKSDAKGQIDVLMPLIADGRLAETRRSLMQRLLSQLSGGQALNRTEPTHEREAFREVAERLCRADGLLGGSEAAEALTRRYVFMMEEGGQSALKKAVAGVVTTVPEPLFQVTYLTALAGSAIGTQVMKEICGILRTVMGVRGIDSLSAPGWPPKDKLLRVTRLYTLIATCEALPEQDRTALTDLADRVLTDYLKRQGIIEKLDDPAAPLRDRTTRLLEFCAARILPTGSRSQSLARERVVAILRQPNFEMHFIEGISDPTRCEDMLRGLHSLLVRGGFR